jgi:putative oxidoreductase
MALGFLTRSLLSGIFVVAGADAAKEPGPRTAVAQQFMKKLGIDLDDAEAATLVQVNGAVMTVAGTALSLGILPRVAALALIGSLLPTTLAGHSFWEHDEEPQRKMNQIQFLKNLGLIGALVSVLITGKGKGRR